MTALLEVNGITQRFGGLVALDDVDLDVPEGSITGLIGPNGAGKTTMFGVITGLLRPTEGTIRFGGTDITSLPSHRRGRLGMARTFQRLELFHSLSVYENLLVAWESRHLAPGEDRAGRARIAEVIELLGLGNVARRRSGTLPTGTSRIVELGRALCAQPRLLMLDEPASGLDRDERERLVRILRQVAEHEDVTILLVEHDVELVFDLCELIHVLEFGRHIERGTRAEIEGSEVVRAAYLGGDLDGAGEPERSESKR